MSARHIKKPIIILGAPRSGTTLLFSILSSHPEIWSMYRESDRVFEDFHPRARGWQQGNALTAEDATSQVIQQIRAAYYAQALNYQALAPERYTKVLTHPLAERIMRRIFRHVVAPLIKPERIRFAEKSPKNCLRVSFLHRVFPDAVFIYLKRAPKPTLHSLITGWQTPERFETYAVPCDLNITGYAGTKWNFLLPLNWQHYTEGKTLAEVCAFQYRVANENALDSLAQIPPEQQLHIAFETLVAAPEKTIQQICEYVGLSYTGGLAQMAQTMPPVNTSTPPDPQKWQQNEALSQAVLPDVTAIAHRMGYDDDL